MKIEVGKTITHNDSDAAGRYGPGIVTSVTDIEYTILWARRGPTKYRRSILDQKLAEVFKQENEAEGAPKERHIHLGASKQFVVLNENYDRARLAALCARLEEADVSGAKEVAQGLTSEFTDRKFTLRPASKKALKGLADLCASHTAEEARQISKELFFGHVIKKADFA